MNDIRFYEEFQDKSKRRPAGTAVAALVVNGTYWSDGILCCEAIAGVFDQPDSPVAGTGAALDYLRQKCQRINETRARTLHPALFQGLDHQP